jgi:hypothetical protein
MKYSKNDVTITKSTVVSVVTSGYSDRFLTTDTIWTVKVFTPNGQSTTCKFEAQDKVTDFLHNLLEFSFEDAFSMLPIETSFWITGKTNAQTHSSRSLTKEDVNTIVVYLNFNHGGSYKEDYRHKMSEYLGKHPLSSEVFAIVQWQIAECDRKNVETWGHKNGRKETA